MSSNSCYLITAVASLLCGLASITSADDRAGAWKRTALDEYVAAPDDAYSWKVSHRKQEPGLTTFVVQLTSQKWRQEGEVDRTTWQHSLVVVKPEGAVANKALLFIGGGRNGDELPRGANEQIKRLAMATRSVVAELRMVPNQPLVFHGDGKQRYEDDLLGYGWDQFLKGGDPDWLPQLPMVKSAVKAMDAVQSLLLSDKNGALRIDQFVVTGGSKRGWTTWLTAAVDRRVCAIAPIVIDVLNIRRSMEHHYAAYGFWAPAIGDYVRHEITHRREWPEYETLLGLVDPFAYRDRLTLPKCLINATGDEFFLPDSSQFYFSELAGEKHLCYVPNASHSLRGTDALESLIAFHHTIVHDTPRPKFSWEFEEANAIRIATQTPPKRVLLWKATNPDARDFRVDTIGRAYQSASLKADDNGQYLAKVGKPEKGWTAYFVQLEFDVGAPVPLRLTTPVRVIPDELPHADKQAPLIDRPE